MPAKAICISYSMSVQVTAPPPRSAPPIPKVSVELVSPPPDKATECKDEGNRFFNRGRYAEARKAYTR
jgi:hypothetical protein